MSDEVKVKMLHSGLIEIANIANEKLAEPAAQRIVNAAGDGYRIDKWDRTTNRGWARTRVWTDKKEAYQRERREGTLARSLGRL